jgi:hypothetical protein
VLQGETTQVSPVEVVLSFRDETACAVLGSHKLEGHQALVLLHPEAETRPAVIELVEGSADRSSVSATLALLTLDSTHEFPGARTLDRTAARTTIMAYDSYSPLHILRELYGFFEALDATRVICDEVLAVLDTRDQYLLPPSRVTSLKLQSPLEITMSVASAPLLVLMALASKFEQIRKLHHTASHSKADAQFRMEEVRTLRVQNDSLEFHAYMEHVAMVPYIAQVLQETGLKGNQRPDLQTVPEALDRINQLLTSQLYPSVNRLFNDNIKAIKFETQLPPIPLYDDKSPDEDNQGAA